MAQRHGVLAPGQPMPTHPTTVEVRPPKPVTSRRTDIALGAVLVILAVSIVVSPGKPAILTGQGNSMYGPKGLRDGAREFCVPIDLIGIRRGLIYEFTDPEGETCLKRAASVQGDYVEFLGDNRGINSSGHPESIDSRSFGLVHRSSVHRVRLFTLPRWFDGPTAAQTLGQPNYVVSQEDITCRTVAKSVIKSAQQQAFDTIRASCKELTKSSSTSEDIAIKLPAGSKIFLVETQNYLMLDLPLSGFAAGGVQDQATGMVVVGMNVDGKIVAGPIQLTNNPVGFGNPDPGPFKPAGRVSVWYK